MGEENGSVEDRVYTELKSMAITFTLRPGERLNEIEIAKQLGVSRTPLRGALNRLNTEGFLRFAPGRGFYSRELNQKSVLDLYELRRAVEIPGLRLSILRRTDEDLDALDRFLHETGPEAGNRTSQELVQLDETFHERLLALSENSEMLRVLRNVNERIRFVRWIAMDKDSRPKTQGEHHEILNALRDRNMQAVELLDKHISQRLDTIVSAIKDGIVRIYMGPTVNT